MEKKILLRKNLNLSLGEYRRGWDEIINIVNTFCTSIHETSKNSKLFERKGKDNTARASYLVWLQL